MTSPRLRSVAARKVGIVSLATGLTASLLFGLTACGSAPRINFYTLNPRGSTVAPVESPLYQVTIGPVSVPEYVDRAQLVVRVGRNEQRVLEERRWVQPLAREIDSALVTSLTRQLERSRVTTLNQSAAATASYRISLDVQRFDSEPGREIQLLIVWTLRDRQGRVLDSGTLSAQRPVEGPSIDALVAAHSAAIEQLAGTLAASLKRQPPTPAASPGSSPDARPAGPSAG